MACERYATTEGLDTARCGNHLVYLRSAALAFLDATVRDSPRAQAYPTSGYLGVLSAGDFMLEFR